MMFYNEMTLWWL